MKIWKTVLPVIASVVFMLVLAGCEDKGGADHPKGEQSTIEQKTDHPAAEHSEPAKAEKSDHPASEHKAEHPE